LGWLRFRWDLGRRDRFKRAKPYLWTHLTLAGKI
jgi:hypothetical protein